MSSLKRCVDHYNVICNFTIDIIFCFCFVSYTFMHFDVFTFLLDLPVSYAIIITHLHLLKITNHLTQIYTYIHLTATNKLINYTLHYTQNRFHTCLNHTIVLSFLYVLRSMFTKIRTHYFSSIQCCTFRNYSII